MLRSLVALPLLSALVALAQTPAPPLPGTPAGHSLQLWLDAINDPQPARVEALVKLDNDETVDGFTGFAHETGGFKLVSIQRAAPTRINVMLQEKASGRSVFGSLSASAGDPPHIESFSLRMLPPGVTVDDPPLDAAERQRVLSGIESALTKSYVYSETAAKMNAALQAHAQHGDYNNITDGSAFAETLTHDLRDVSHDMHLHIEYAPFVQPVRPPEAKPTPEDRARMRQQLEDINCAFEKVEILPRNIGYLKFNMFAPPDVCGPTAAAAMAFLAHTKAVIIDVRQNGGGDPAMVQLIVSYLFDHTEHINDLYYRAKDETTQYWTLPWVPGERLATQPIFVLTSHRTFSGAEEFTYDLKNLKRATIVGETTGGGAHPMHGEQIDSHFTIGVPAGRPINPVTKTDWEGTGVTPDEKTSADDALPTAIKLAEAKLQADAAQPANSPAPAAPAAH
ncbi:MAG TPA: S41 family peptidase [Acidobacteriaceae bacterium]|jgi:C-terminal processing protease CtpA/Prc